MAGSSLSVSTSFVGAGVASVTMALVGAPVPRGEGVGGSVTGTGSTRGLSGSVSSPESSLHNVGPGDLVVRDGDGFTSC